MNTIFKCNEQLIFDVFPDGEAVVYDDKNETTHVLNETALLAYNACVGYTYQQAEENFLKNFNFSDEIQRAQNDIEDSNKGGVLNPVMNGFDTVSRKEILNDFKFIVDDFIKKEILLCGGV